MKIRIFIIIAFSFFCSTQNLSAQVFSYFKKIKTLKENRKNNEKKAKIAYKNGDYQTVYETYKKNLQKAKLSPKAQYDYAQVALNLRDYDTAIDLFSKITTKKNEFRFAHYLYGTALKNKGRYQEAITQFGKFLERDTVYMNKNKYAKTAQTHIVGCNEAIKFVEQKTGFQIDTLQKILNTGEGEFAPALYLKQDNGEQSLFFSYSDETIHILKRLTETGEIVKFQGEFGDTGYYTTHASISHDEKQLFFTRCEELSNGDMSCAVYSADIDKYANVSNPVKLNSNVNVEGYSAMSPFLSKNNEGEEILFFASNRVGGRGGYDLWYSVRLSNGEFTKAYNLGRKINSEYDEITPFFFAQTGTLYYSSNNPAGIGGFDIYKTQGWKKYWKEPTLLGLPINSSYDETNYILANTRLGYFSSNRKGSVTNRNRVPSNDIYKFSRPNIHSR